jgi:hypothetical protein
MFFNNMLLDPITIKTIPIRFEEWTEEELEHFYYEFISSQDENDLEVKYSNK